MFVLTIKLVQKAFPISTSPRSETRRRKEEKHTSFTQNIIKILTFRKSRKLIWVYENCGRRLKYKKVIDTDVRNVNLISINSIHKYLDVTFVIRSLEIRVDLAN